MKELNQRILVLFLLNFSLSTSARWCMGSHLVGSLQFQASVLSHLPLTCCHSGGRQMASPDRQAPPYSMNNCQSRADRGAIRTHVTCVPSTLHRLISPSSPPPHASSPVTNTLVVKHVVTLPTLLSRAYP